MKLKKLTKSAIAIAAASSMAFAGIVIASSGSTVIAASSSTAVVNPNAKSPVTAGTFTKPTAASALSSDEITGTSLTFSDASVEASSTDGLKIEDTYVTIQQAGTYYISGTCSNGQIKVKKSVTGVTLVFNGLTLANTGTDAPLLMNSGTEVELILYGENTLSDTDKNNEDQYTDGTEADNAVIKAKSESSFTISGEGLLTVNANGKNGIKANGALVIDGGIFDITAVDNGISNEATIEINDGYFDITAQEGDGIKSAADNEATGSITINGGTILIDAYKDGIQALAGMTINDGYFDITCCGGVANTSYDKDKDDNSAKGIKAKGSYKDADTSEEVEVNTQELNITGGTFYLDCADDAIASGKDVNLTGGYYEIKSGDDGVHAEYTTTIGTENGADSDLYLLISTSFEGIEGATVNINSGTLRVYATDDGINAANSDLSSSNPTRFGQRYSGYDFQLNINGGNVYVSCMSGDGLDSNNSLTITGGNTVVLATVGQKSASSENGGGEGDALDCDGTLTVSGGQVLAIGVKSENPSNYISFGTSSGNNMGGGFGGRGGGNGNSSNSGSSSVSIKQDDTVAVYDNSGNAVLATVAKWLSTDSSYTATYAVYSAKDVTTSSGYTLKVNEYEFEDEEDDTSASPSPDASDTPDASEEPDSSTEPDSSATPAPSDTSGTTEYIKGDVNNDSKVNLKDAQLVLKAYLKMIELDDAAKKAADVNNDNKVNLTDAQLILQSYLIYDKID